MQLFNTLELQQVHNILPEYLVQQLLLTGNENIIINNAKHYSTN